MIISNKQKADEYYKKCKQVLKGKLAEGSLNFSVEGKIVRSEIYKAINASRAVMNQNPRIRRLLGATERLARIKRITAVISPERSNRAWRVSGSCDPAVIQMQTRLNYLERQVVALTVENRELRKAVKRADWIDKFINNPQGKQGALPW